MKAITLHQPWASLIALGVKTIETRAWSTNYRGPLAIHAAKTTKPWRNLEAPSLKSQRATINAILEAFGVVQPDGSWPSRWAEEGNAIWYGFDFALPLGAVVATCTLTDVVPIVDAWPKAPSWVYVKGEEFWLDLPRKTPMHVRESRDVSDQRAYGDFTPGRWAWLLTDIEPLAEPAPARGRQGVWEWS